MGNLLAEGLPLMNITRTYFIAIASILSVGANAQEIQNVHADFDGEKVIISYDLVSPYLDDRFSVLLFSSHDDFKAPLSLLVGDAGANVSGGRAHRITWDAKSSLPSDFNAEITFKVKASIAVSLHHASRLDAKPLDFASYKRGGILNLEWNGGREKEPIAIELLKNDELVEKISEAENNNLYSWTIPGKTKPGKDYSIRVSKVNDSRVSTMSQPFQIKPKVALWMKLVPVAVVGGIVAVLAGSKDEEPDLPGPISPD
jgi:hypothetical protein